MGNRGPIPKRAEQRRRRNLESAPTTIAAPAAPVPCPPLGFPTHPIAEEWYRSLAASGQAHWYEPSDWQAARVVAHELGRALEAGRPSAQMFAAVWSAMGELLTTEGARRRVRVEIDRGQPGDADEDAAVAALDDYRRRLA